MVDTPCQDPASAGSPGPLSAAAWCFRVQRTGFQGLASRLPQRTILHTLDTSSGVTTWRNYDSPSSYHNTARDVKLEDFRHVVWLIPGPWDTMGAFGPNRVWMGKCPEPKTRECPAPFPFFRSREKLGILFPLFYHCLYHLFVYCEQQSRVNQTTFSFLPFLSLTAWCWTFLLLLSLTTAGLTSIHTHCRLKGPTQVR